jgi:hypothetical protein
VWWNHKVLVALLVGNNLESSVQVPLHDKLIISRESLRALPVELALGLEVSFLGTSVAVALKPALNRVASNTVCSESAMSRSQTRIAVHRSAKVRWLGRRFFVVQSSLNVDTAPRCNGAIPVQT